MQAVKNNMENTLNMGLIAGKHWLIYTTRIH